MNPYIDAGMPHTVQPSEYALEQSAEANRKERAELARERFPKAPQTIDCRICKVTFPNPILEGSSIVLVTCKDCRINMMGSRAKNKAIKQGIVSKRGLERAENAVSEAPAIISPASVPVAEIPPLYLSDFARDADE